MNDSILTLVGFAKKSGNLAIGRSAVIKAFERNQLFLVIIAKDASNKIFKGYGNMNAVPVFEYALKEQYKDLFDKEVAIIGIIDRQFATSIIKKLPPEAKLSSV